MLPDTLKSKLEGIEDRVRELELLLSDPGIIGDQTKFRALSREHAELDPLVRCYQRYHAVEDNLAAAEEMLRDGDAGIRAMAEEDGVEINDEQWHHIMKAREFYEEQAVVPPIRKFAKYIEQDQKDVFDLWMTGPMKPITKYGGMPKPTGCV